MLLGLLVVMAARGPGTGNARTAQTIDSLEFGGGYAYTLAATNTTTLNLTLSDSDETSGNGITGTWTMENMLPGDTVAGSMNLSNPGELKGDNVSLSFSSTGEDSGCLNGTNEEPDTLCGAGGMPATIEVLSMSYGGESYSMTPGTSFEDSNGNGYIDLEDLETPVNDQKLSGLPPPGNGVKTFSMSLRFRPDAGNDYQGDTVKTKITAVLTGA